MIHTIQQELTLPVPLTISAHHTAQLFYQQHSDPHKAKQIYLNTLAVEAVHTYLSWVGITSDRQASDSWDPVVQSLADVADLEIPGQGKLECRPVLPENTTCCIPPESCEGRIGYLPVLLDAELQTATLLGFISSKDIENTEEEFPLTSLQPITSLFDYLEPQPNLTDQKRTALGQWLKGVAESGWQTVEELLSPQPMFSFRCLELSASTELVGAAVRGKLLELAPPTIASTSASIDGLYEHQGHEPQSRDMLSVTQPIGHRVALIVGIAPSKALQSNICIKLCPVDDDRYLPEDLEVRVLDDRDIVVMEAQSRQTDMIQLHFRGMLNEQFTVEVALNGASLVEKFVI